MSHKISFTLMIIGITVMMIGLQLIVGGFAIIEFTDILKEHPPELKNEIGTLLELREQIQILLQKQSFELTHSEGLVWVGIGSALFVSGMPLFLSGRKDFSDFSRAKDFLNDDFLDLHNKLLTINTNLEGAINDLKTNGNIVNNLINKKGRPLDLIINYITRLSFALWDSSMDQFKHFTKDEQKILKELHDFILESNGYIAPRENSLVSELEKILKAGSVNMKQELTDKLLEIFEINVYSYRLIFDRMHHELDSIKWIKNQSWDKEVKLPNAKKRLVVDKKGAYWYEQQR